MVADSWAATEGSRRSMKSNRGRDTGPELRVRSAVHRRGLRYRVCVRPEPSLRRTADLVFAGARVAVFVDGCFWHGCPQHGTRPQRNAEWWAEKLDANQRRDAECTAALDGLGWLVLRYWEHEEPTAVAADIERHVRARQTANVVTRSSKSRRRR